MTHRPDYSAGMLKVFLRMRARFLVIDGQAASLQVAKDALRRQAGVTATMFDMAWMGRLQRAETRARLWGSLGILPVVRLTDEGGQDAR